ncbi:thioesterase II family protein [Marinomonas sp. PE14-40]|uniref:thioesterase II family protein n=1 Tax=Marinomonas sp. PE14-40 TaxID=3060621 RepID=UPI003F674D59
MQKHTSVFPINTQIQGSLPTLFCLPSAGGSAAMYREWQKNLQKIQVIPVEYPGRGSRFTETFAEDIKSLARDIAHTIVQTKITQFSLFGHSLGALISWEITLELQKRNYPLPQKLWVSARKAPHFKPSTERRSDLNDTQLLALLKEMGGTPEEFLNNIEFQALLLPIIRADLKLHDDYVFHQEHKERPILAVPIIALGGQDDTQVAYDTLSEWGRYSDLRFEQFEFQGGHFYLQEASFLDWFKNKLSL